MDVLRWLRRVTHRCRPFVNYKGKRDHKGDPIERYLCPECGQAWKFLPAVVTWQDQFDATWVKLSEISEP